ncbi:MAG: hypothetical protein GVY15_02670 [Bacteroidetes bacterium]|jgi:Tol biopolymer transport system component/DNA-binding winged helix-turn-helix (wHTH) protein|nr:hypothetical protein [Bacteroidota bacterium]
MDDEKKSSSSLARGFRVGDWVVRPTLNRLRRGDVEHSVEPKVMQTLVCLARRSGEVVTKEVFMDEVWEGTVVSDDVLARSISELRKTLDDDARDPTYIETIRKSGYRLLVPVSAGIPRPSAVADPASFEDADGFGAGGFGWGRLRVVATVAGLAAFCVGLLLGWLMGQTADDPAGVSPPRARPLTTFPGGVAEPRVSPSGDRVAFVWRPGPEAFEQLYIKQGGAETPLRLTDARAAHASPAWAPDGQSLAFVRRTEDTEGLYVVSSIGGTPRPLLVLENQRIQSIDWIPDSTRQAFVLSIQDEARGPYRVHTYDVDRDSLYRHSSPAPYGAGDVHVRASPDGQRVAFVRTWVPGRQDVFVATREEPGTARRVTADSAAVRGIAWTPTGDALLVASDRDGGPALWSFPLNGAPPTWMRSGSGRSVLAHPSVTVDGQRLVFAEHRRSLSMWRLALSSTDTVAAVRAFGTSTRSDFAPAVAPDTSRVAFISTRTGPPRLYMQALRAPDAVPVSRAVPPCCGAPAWGPDGALVYASGATGAVNLYRVHPDRGTQMALTGGPYHDHRPHWSASGSWVYFISNRGGTWQPWRTALHTFAPERVSRHHAQRVVPHPLTTDLLISRPDTAGVWAIDALRPEPLVAVGAIPPSILLDRLGRNESSAGIKGPFMADATPSLDVLGATPTHSAPRLVVSETGPEGAAAWTVVGTTLYFIRRTSTMAWRSRSRPTSAGPW